jgi:cytochrome c553
MSPPRTWKLGTLATLGVLALACGAFVMGFYVLPDANPLGTAWQRLCRAAGFVADTGSRTAIAPLPGYTRAVIPRVALEVGTARQIGRGATLALRCTACHGAQGVSGADAPNLAGQYPEVIYKELLDYQHGDRVDAVMNAMVATLTAQDLLDLAHYYAYLPQPEHDRPLAQAPALVRVGDPMRNIAPCASCHGSRNGKVGAPNLAGEPRRYLGQQLTAFARGTRRNDANAQMRNEARLLTAAEIVAVTDHYSGLPPDPE